MNASPISGSLRNEISFAGRDGDEVGAECPEHRVAEADQADVGDEEVDAEREQPEVERALREMWSPVAREERDQADEDDHREPDDEERLLAAS